MSRMIDYRRQRQLGGRLLERELNKFVKIFGSPKNTFNCYRNDMFDKLMILEEDLSYRSAEIVPGRLRLRISERLHKNPVERDKHVIVKI